MKYNPDEGRQFRLSISMGLVDGHSTIDKFGVIRNLAEGSEPADIWEFGGLYNYDANGTAPIAYISSNSALDTGQEILVSGLDINGVDTIQSVTTNGTSNVTLTTPLWRVYRMSNNSDEGNDINGTLYCHTDPSPVAGVPADANVRAIINGSHNQTLMALYTIPKGKVGFLYRGEAGVTFESLPSTTQQLCSIHYESRRYGKVFNAKKEIGVLTAGDSNYTDVRSFPDIIPALTDIKLKVTDLTTTLSAWATIDILLVDESKFTTEYLKNIRQPGY